MGKKRPQHTTGADSQKERKKVSTVSSPPPPPLRKIAYNAMPVNHNKKFFINDDVGGTLRKYIEVISWLRVMGCFDGSVFEDIPNLNWSGEGYPLPEVEVITPQQKSAKFVIVFSLLDCLLHEFQYRCEFDIDSFTFLEEYHEKYTTRPWEHVGPKNMIYAINVLAGKNNDINTSDVAVMKLYAAAFEVFYVHLCEAARLYVVEPLVCIMLEPPIAGGFENQTYLHEEGVILIGEDHKIVDNIQDVYSLVKGNGPVNFNLSVGTPAYINMFINYYKQMSNVWFTYSL